MYDISTYLTLPFSTFLSCNSLTPDPSVYASPQALHDCTNLHWCVGQHGTWDISLHIPSLQDRQSIIVSADLTNVHNPIPILHIFTLASWRQSVAVSASVWPTNTFSQSDQSLSHWGLSTTLHVPLRENLFSTSLLAWPLPMKGTGSTFILPVHLSLTIHLSNIFSSVRTSHPIRHGRPLHTILLMSTLIQIIPQGRHWHLIFTILHLMCYLLHGSLSLSWLHCPFRTPPQHHLFLADLQLAEERCQGWFNGPWAQ